VAKLGHDFQAGDRGAVVEMLALDWGLRRPDQMHARQPLALSQVRRRLRQHGIR
jgi:hypothetical protein